MRTVLIVVGAAVALTGCVTSKQIIGPDGQAAYSIRCNGTANSWGDCLAKAGEICGAKGYNVLERNGEPVSAFFGSGYANPTSASMSMGGASTIHRSMVASCKG